MDQSQLLHYLIEAFEDLGIEYMIGGSQASIYYGEPRFTQDLDVVADIRAEHVGLLLHKFPMPEFYVSEDAMREALRERSQFNIIHPTSGLKIDVILPKTRAYDRVQFARRQRLPLLAGRDAYFARLEDVIIYKLLYYRDGGSEKHLRDIAGILAISGDHMDRPYLTQWIEQLDLAEYWQQVTAERKK